MDDTKHGSGALGLLALAAAAAEIAELSEQGHSDEHDVAAVRFGRLSGCASQHKRSRTPTNVGLSVEGYRQEDACGPSTAKRASYGLQVASSNVPALLPAFTTTGGQQLPAASAQRQPLASASAATYHVLERPTLLVPLADPRGIGAVARQLQDEMRRQRAPPSLHKDMPDKSSQQEQPHGSMSSKHAEDPQQQQQLARFTMGHAPPPMLAHKYASRQQRRQAAAAGQDAAPARPSAGTAAAATATTAPADSPKSSSEGSLPSAAAASGTGSGSGTTSSAEAYLAGAQPDAVYSAGRLHARPSGQPGRPTLLYGSQRLPPADMAYRRTPGEDTTDSSAEELQRVALSPAAAQLVRGRPAPASVAEDAPSPKRLAYSQPHGDEAQLALQRRPGAEPQDGPMPMPMPAPQGRAAAPLPQQFGLPADYPSADRRRTTWASPGAHVPLSQASSSGDPASQQQRVRRHSMIVVPVVDGRPVLTAEVRQALAAAAAGQEAGQPEPQVLFAVMGAPTPMTVDGTPSGQQARTAATPGETRTWQQELLLHEHHQRQQLLQQLQQEQRRQLQQGAAVRAPPGASVDPSLVLQALAAQQLQQQQQQRVAAATATTAAPTVATPAQAVAEDRMQVDATASPGLASQRKHRRGSYCPSQHTAPSLDLTAAPPVAAGPALSSRRRATANDGDNMELDMAVDVWRTPSDDMRLNPRMRAVLAARWPCGAAAGCAEPMDVSRSGSSLTAAAGCSFLLPAYGMLPPGAGDLASPPMPAASPMSLGPSFSSQGGSFTRGSGSSAAWAAPPELSGLLLQRTNSIGRPPPPPLDLSQAPAGQQPPEGLRHQQQQQAAQQPSSHEQLQQPPQQQQQQLLHLRRLQAQHHALQAAAAGEERGSRPRGQEAASSCGTGSMTAAELDLHTTDSRDGVQRQQNSTQRQQQMAADAQHTQQAWLQQQQRQRQETIAAVQQLQLAQQRHQHQQLMQRQHAGNAQQHGRPSGTADQARPTPAPAPAAVAAAVAEEPQPLRSRRHSAEKVAEAAAAVAAAARNSRAAGAMPMGLLDLLAGRRLSLSELAEGLAAATATSQRLAAAGQSGAMPPPTAATAAAHQRRAATAVAASAPAGDLHVLLPVPPLDLSLHGASPSPAGRQPLLQLPQQRKRLSDSIMESMAGSAVLRGPERSPRSLAAAAGMPLHLQQRGAVPISQLLAQAPPHVLSSMAEQLTQLWL